MSTLTIQSRLRVSYRVVMIQVDASACTICFVSRYVMGGWCTELVYTTSESKFSCNNSSCFSFPLKFSVLPTEKQMMRRRCRKEVKDWPVKTLMTSSITAADRLGVYQLSAVSAQPGIVPTHSCLIALPRAGPRISLLCCCYFFRFSSSISMP